VVALSLTDEHGHCQSRAVLALTQQYARVV
jgi:hypothetical protein